MQRKSSHVVLRSVVLPALGVSLATLAVAHCDRGPNRQNVDQQPREFVTPPGMVALPGVIVMPLTVRDAGAPIAADNNGADGNAPADASAVEPEVRPIPRPPPPRDPQRLRPPPGPPARVPRVVRPRPGPPSRDEFEKSLADEKPAETQAPRTPRRTRGRDDGNTIPGIAGARRPPR
jgi:hypothetical protein